MGGPGRDGGTGGRKSGEITEVNRSQDASGRDDQGNAGTQPRRPTRRATVSAYPPAPPRRVVTRTHRLLITPVGAAPRRPHDQKPKDSLCCSIQ